MDKQYYPDPPHLYLATEVGKKDLDDHMFGRLHGFRSVTVPWLASILPLQGARVLEIGCGTGASTIALAEQGAHVLGLDVSEGALEVGRQRARLYGLEADFTAGNAADLPRVIGDRQFDAIIYFAVLEHMTWAERQASLIAAWSHLRSGKHLIVIETPNRLWYEDNHTANELFFHWISDEAAAAYSRFTQREIYNKMFSQPLDDEQRTLLARWGRGASFHDFVLAFETRPEHLPVAGHLSAFLRQGLSRIRSKSRFAELMQKLAPDVHPAFFCPYLDLGFRKP